MAPFLKIDANTLIATGDTSTKYLAEYNLAIAKTSQENKEGYAKNIL